MIEIILATLIELGLLRGDYNHRKQIRKKEKKDGVKRPIQKYLLKPSAITGIILVILVSLSSSIYFKYRNTTLLSKKTQLEISEISENLEEWNDLFNNYPSKLKDLIGNNPMKQDWSNDEWNRPYKFEIINKGQEFLITSAGHDGVFDTEDDIISK